MTAVATQLAFALIWMLAGGLLDRIVMVRRQEKSQAARANARVDGKFGDTLARWQAADGQATGRHAADEQDHADVEGAPASPINRAKPRWAGTLEAWGQPRPPAGYPPPPALTAEPDPRVAEPTAGRAPVVGVAPLDFGEQISALNVALGGRARWAADAEETGWIPAVRA